MLGWEWVYQFCINRPMFLTMPEFLTIPKLDQNSVFFHSKCAHFSSCLSYTSTMFATVGKEICTGTLQPLPKLLLVVSETPIFG